MPSPGARWLVAAGVCASVVTGLAAADVTGTWIGTLAKRGRTPAKDVAFRFAQDGSALHGKAYSDSGSSDAIVSGEVIGSRIRFDVEAREQAGNQINIVVYKFEGTVDGTEIELTRQKASARNAANGSDVPVRRPGDSEEEDRERRFRTFTLERLFR